MTVSREREAVSSKKSGGGLFIAFAKTRIEQEDEGDPRPLNRGAIPGIRQTSCTRFTMQFLPFSAVVIW